MLLEELIEKINELDTSIVNLIEFVLSNQDSDHSKTVKFNLELSLEMYKIEQLIAGLSLYFGKLPNLQEKFLRLRAIYTENFVPKKETEKIGAEIPNNDNI
jgi:hypothetical protein